MLSYFSQALDLTRDAGEIARRPYGMIEMADGELVAIQFRPWPKLFTWSLWPGATAGHARAPGDRCWLYYNQPRSCRDFLALKYVVSTRGCSLRTFRGSLVVLDEVARIKQSRAIVCQVASAKISDRLLDRWGWQPHFAASNQRHYIKRFYGEFPAR